MEYHRCFILLVLCCRTAPANDLIVRGVAVFLYEMVYRVCFGCRCIGIKTSQERSMYTHITAKLCPDSFLQTIQPQKRVLSFLSISGLLRFEMYQYMQAVQILNSL